MAGIRFLERLRATQHNPDSLGEEDTAAVLQSIISYAALILNTRKGSALLDTDMGIPDFTSRGMQFTNEDIPHIERSIAEVLARYEPRLTDVQVRLIPDSNAAVQMVFELQASLNTAKKSPIRLLTRITPQGRVTVGD